jgi:hypothetical protein
MAKCPWLLMHDTPQSTKRERKQFSKRGRVSVAKGEFGQIGVILSPIDSVARRTL